MPYISSCPECHRDLTIADALDARRRLRCPHCRAEFLAEQVMADAVPIPLAAIELDLPEEQESPGEEQAQPAESHDAQTAPSEAGAEESEVAAAEEGEEQRQSVRVRSTPRPKGSSFGFLGQIVGMVLGGVLGLAIGYYILLWIGGPQADFLEIRQKLPRWMLPPQKGREPAPWRRGAATRSLGDLLEEPDEPQLAMPAGETTSDGAPAAPEAIPTAFEQPSRELPDKTTAPAEALAVDVSRAAAGGEPPSAADQASAAGPVGPRGFNAYSLDDLEGALARAGAALGCEYCHSTGFRLIPPPAGSNEREASQPQRVRCEHCGGKPAPGVTAGAFDRLCQLADAATFAQLDADDAQRERVRMQIHGALSRIGEDRGKTQIVGRLASSRLEDSQRMTNGILLAGTVQELGYEGPLYRIKLVLLGVPKTVIVVSQEAPQPPLAKHDRVLILGSIVDSPAENLAGYTGNLTQVVWGGLPIKLGLAGR